MIKAQGARLANRVNLHLAPGDRSRRRLQSCQFSDSRLKRPPLREQTPLPAPKSDQGSLATTPGPRRDVGTPVIGHVAQACRSGFHMMSVSAGSSSQTDLDSWDGLGFAPAGSSERNPNRWAIGTARLILSLSWHGLRSEAAHLCYARHFGLEWYSPLPKSCRSTQTPSRTLERLP